MNGTSKSRRWIFLCFSLFQFACALRIVEEPKVHYLSAGDSVENNNPGLKIYCHNATSKYITHMWRTMTMYLSANTDSYDLYDGKTPSEIYQKHEKSQRLLSFTFLDTGKHTQFRINPFEDTCIGIFIDPSSDSKYIMSLMETRINVWRLTIMLTGIILFWFAQLLSQNSLFYYTCGIAFGVSLSILILIYMAGKLVPRGKVMYLVFAASMSLYLVRLLWENAQLIALQYREWVMWYILTTSLISFVICYRFGPVTNVRTKKIIQWSLQLVGLILMYNSNHFYEASVSCCVLLVLFYNFPKGTLERGKRYWQRTFPERRKLLDESQYRLQGAQETKKALKGLRTYCSSPECNSWKTVLKLKDPIRFAKFVEGNSHLSEYEVEEHEEELSKILDEDEYTDDD